jgi:hypothetical protein
MVGRVARSEPPDGEPGGDRRRRRRGGRCSEDAHSRRVIDLDPATTSLLQRHRTRERKLFLRLGPSAHASDRVFTNEIGDPIRPNSIGQAFARLGRHQREGRQRTTRPRIGELHPRHLRPRLPGHITRTWPASPRRVLGYGEFDVCDSCGFGEQVERALWFDELFVDVEGEQPARRSAAAGDVDRAVLGGLLGAAGVSIELSAGLTPPCRCVSTTRVSGNSLLESHWCQRPVAVRKASRISGRSRPRSDTG